MDMSFKFDVKKEEIKALDEAMKQIAEYKKHSGMPDYSKNWVAYVLPLTLALLKSEKTLNRLTWILIVLTIALVLQNIIILLAYLNIIVF